MCLFSVFHVKRREPRRVLITGFGDFKGVDSNPSWLGVSCMDRNKIEWQNQIALLREKIGVRYHEVDLVVPVLWRSFKPHLTIHVGVHPTTQCFLLETRARKSGYGIEDADNKYPSPTAFESESYSSITTTLNVERICKRFNDKPPGKKLKAKLSSDAGLYLCEYIYYTSLCRGPTLFVHVPAATYTDEDIARGLQRILELCLKYS